MAVADPSLPALLEKLANSLDSASQAIPEAILPPEDGISLLDVKNELFLSYLQHLVFLILIKLRHQRDSASSDLSVNEQAAAAVKRLASLRVYLEKGIRPLEGKLKYQVDKVVRAADDAARATPQKKQKQARTKSGSGSEDVSSEEDDEEDEEEDTEANALAFRPNVAAFAASAAAAAQKNSLAMAKSSDAKSDGIYRPPRISATAMPTTESREKASRPAKPLRSAAVDDYVASELDGAPLAEPSIGSTIRRGGRDMQTERQRRDDAERQAYEEANFVRLAPSRADKKQAKHASRSRGSAGWGADEFSLGSLGGAGADRISRATGRDRKRGADGQRGSGYDEGTIRFGGKGSKRRKTGRK